MNTVIKTANVIVSCKTETQFDCAIKYFNLFLETLPRGKYYIADNIRIVRYLEGLLRYKQGELGVKI